MLNNILHTFKSILRFFKTRVTFQANTHILDRVLHLKFRLFVRKKGNTTLFCNLEKVYSLNLLWEV